MVVATLNGYCKGYCTPQKLLEAPSWPSGEAALSPTVTIFLSGQARCLLTLTTAKAVGFSGNACGNPLR